MKNKSLFIGIAVVVLIGSYFLGNYIFKQQQNENLALLGQENAELFVRDYSPRMGSSKPKVLLIEFLDPECESCRAFYPYVKQIMKDHMEDVQLIVRYMPFHKNSKFVIKVLEASRKQNKYWEVLEILFRYQPEWGNHHNPNPELIWTYLPMVGIDIAKIKEDMKNPEFDKIIAQDKADGELLKVRATPSFFINGKPLTEFGYQPLLNMIKTELEKK
ncbi:MAG: protein-disulfide isomerase [Bacteriovoracaceae bacterium]|jgi:protein-disulfide isomerase